MNELEQLLSNPDILEEQDKFSGLSRHLSSLFSTYKNKRTLKEQEWIKNQNQYDGVYEDEILKAIPKGKSKVYNKVTAAKINQFVSRTTELVLPNGDKNYALYPTPKPNLPKNILEDLLNSLNKSAFEQEKQLTEQDIHFAVKTFATERAQKMENTIFDQLSDFNYAEIIAKVIRSSGIYGFGVVKGPFNMQKTETDYKQNEYGVWVTNTKKKQKPFFEFIKVWDCYFDLDAKKFGQDEGAFFTHTMNRKEFNKLAKRQDFISQNIKDYIWTKPKGNYMKESWETQLESSGTETENTSLITNKYRLKEFWGSVPREMLTEIFSEEELGEDYDVEVNVWMVDDIIIKCILNPFDTKKRPYEVFNYNSTDAMLLGTGLCKLLEQDQRAINSVSRAIINNMAMSAEPIYEINDDLLPPGKQISVVHPGMVIHREGTDVNSGFQAVRTYNIPNIIAILIQLEQFYRQKIDDISNLNQIMNGDMANQATLGRTSSGITQLMGAANITLRDFARNFDFFNQNLITKLIEWNMMFNDDEDIKGDYQVFPRVSTALIEKQMTANNLNNLVVTMTPEEREFTNWEAIFDARLRANNLDPDLIKLSAQAVAENRQNQSQQVQQQQQMAMQQFALDLQKTQAEIQDIQASAQSKMVKAQNETDKVDLNRIQTLNNVESGRSKQMLEEGKFQNQLLNEDMAQSFTKEELSQILQTLSGKNPNLNVEVK